jgi:hypothetical protein
MDSEIKALFEHLIERQDRTDGKLDKLNVAIVGDGYGNGGLVNDIKDRHVHICERLIPLENFNRKLVKVFYWVLGGSATGSILWAAAKQFLGI